MARGFYDSNILIAYLFKEEKRFEKADKALKIHPVRAVSIITVHEIHFYSVKYHVENRFLRVKKALNRMFKILPLNQKICVKASRLRSQYGLPEIDSLILATAVSARYEEFYTLDRDFTMLNGKTVEATRVNFIE